MEYLSNDELISNMHLCCNNIIKNSFLYEEKDYLSINIEDKITLLLLLCQAPGCKTLSFDAASTLLTFMNYTINNYDNLASKLLNRCEKLRSLYFKILKELAEKNNA